MGTDGTDTHDAVDGANATKASKAAGNAQGEAVGGIALPFLQGYPEPLLAQVRQRISLGELAPALAKRYGQPQQQHEVRTDRALFDYVNTLKLQHLRNAEPLSKVAFDNKLHVVQQALGTHTSISRVQGNKLKAKREIRVASLFKEAPADFLKMIVVHELAHLKERAHDKAFYALCTHLEPDYHQLEFDLRLWLTLREQTTAQTPGQMPGQTLKQPLAANT